MTLLADVAAVLRRHRIPFALIGAGAMAVHGVSRSTADLDLLATDDRCLDPTVWTGVGTDVAVDVRRGDAADPLAGVVRLTRSGEIDLDVIVGRPSWQRDVVGRASLRAEHDVPVVTLSDLILLKLYACGSQDMWDVEQLLVVDASGAAMLEVEQRLDDLPADSQDLWKRLRAGRR